MAKNTDWIALPKTTYKKLMTAFYNQPLEQRRKVIATAIVLMAVLFGLFLFKGFKLSYRNPTKQPVAQVTPADNLVKLNELEAHLQQVQQSITTMSSEQQETHTQVRAIIEQLKILASHDTELKESLNALQRELSDNKTDLGQQIYVISQDIKTLKQTHMPAKTFINQKLPFNVIAIDYWNGAAYATISLNHQNSLLGLKEQKAGWRLVDILNDPNV